MLLFSYLFQSTFRGTHVLKTAVNVSSNSFNNDTKEQLVLFTKLFLIMGITWLSECIHVELHGDHTNMEHCNFHLEVFLRVLGGLNMIRGFFIFLVFICKPKILKWTQERHPKLWKWLKCFNCCKYEISEEENSRVSLKFEAKAIDTKMTNSNAECIEMVNLSRNRMSIMNIQGESHSQTANNGTVRSSTNRLQVVMSSREYVSSEGIERKSGVDAEIL